MSTSLCDDTETLYNEMIDLPCWLFDEHLTSTEVEKSVALSPKKQQRNIVKTMQNSKIQELVFQNNMISIFIKIIIYFYEFLKIVTTTTYSVLKLRMTSKHQTYVYIGKAEQSVGNLNSIMETLRIYASKAAEEHKQVSSHFNNMKTQIEKQEEILDKNLIEINNLKAKINEANLNSTQQNKVIESLGCELEKNKQQLFNTENKLAAIIRQLRSSVSSQFTDELQSFNESDENYIFIVNHIRDMKIKIQQQENHLASILQLINKLDELHDFNKTIDQQTKSIIFLKDGLRRKSANIFENLKNIAGRVSESTILDDNVSEDPEVFDENLNVIDQNTKSFIEELGVKLELPEGNEGLDIPPQRRFSDMLKQNLSINVIQNSTQISNATIAPIRELSICQPAVIEKTVTTFEKEIQTSLKIEFIDVGCQTIESPLKNNDSSTNSFKNKLQKTLDNFNSVQERHERMRETLDAYKLEKGQAGERCHYLIDDLEKKIDSEIFKLKTQIEEKDSNISSLNKKLLAANELIKENANLKELLDSAKEENYKLKDEIAKLSVTDKEKDKKIAVLEEDLKVTKHSYEQNIVYLKKEAENMRKDFMLLNQKLLTEKENIKNLKQHYKKVNQHLEDQIKTHETTIVNFKIDNDMLRNTYEVLDKKLKDTNTEYNNAIKKRDETIMFYKLANRNLSTEIKNLKEEVKKLSALSQKEKDKYPRTVLQENVQYRSRSNSKEYDGNTQIPTNLYRNFPHLHSNITCRAKSSPTERRK